MTFVKVGFVFIIFQTACAGQTYKTSDHYNGKTFFNPQPFKEQRLGDFFKWITSRKSSTWPDWVEIEPTQPPPAVAKPGSINYTFINHSTVLIQVDGKNIITDPIYSERASPVQFMGPKRVHSPGVPFEQLPKIDYILISHNHYDHMDQETVTRLIQRDQPIIVTGLGNKELIESWGGSRVTELDWKEIFRHQNLEFTFVRAQHFSARGIFDRDQTLWGGFMVKTSLGYIYFAGDTGYGEFIPKELAKYQPLLLALIPIGAYEPRWFMSPVHTNPAEAIRIHEELSSQNSVGIHFGTFSLADDNYSAPVEALKDVLSKKDQNNLKPFRIPKIGETFHLKIEIY